MSNGYSFAQSLKSMAIVGGREMGLPSATFRNQLLLPLPFPVPSSAVGIFPDSQMKTSGLITQWGI